MAKRVLALLQDTTGDTLRFIPCERISLDTTPSPYTDAFEHTLRASLETPKPEKTPIAVRELPRNHSPVLRYFMDGSRKTYRVADLVLDGRYYMPLIAGQVGVAVLRRTEEHTLVPERRFSQVKRVLAFPDRIANAIDYIKICYLFIDTQSSASI